MKNLLKTTLLFLLVFISHSVHSQMKIQIMASNLNKIEFKLIGDGVIKYSNSDYIIELSETEVEMYQNKTFTLFFKDDLANLLYYRDLYYSRGNDRDDAHIKYNEITINDLLGKVLYLRRIELPIDDY